MARHARKKMRQAVDERRPPQAGAATFAPVAHFPPLPAAADAPKEMRSALAGDVMHLLAGRWLAFGHLPLKVDDPPRWHMDYLAGRDYATDRSAFRLNHRALPAGGDSKLVWELSRWTALVRLAMAAYVLPHREAGEKCLEWLEDWCRQNPPYHGWNWTSALEAGIRLIQFAWIDALLSASPDGSAWAERLAGLRRAILPAHVAFAWRHRSFGSSANNHLLGELTGLVMARARWPEVQRWLPSVPRLGETWASEVLRQFAPDGGNREQALNYQLFSLEFAWQGRLAVGELGLRADQVLIRCGEAARFFHEVQSPHDPWDYGDSDSAFVTPWYLDERHAVAEWHHWVGWSPQPTGLLYWLGDPPPVGRPPSGSGAPLATKLLGDWWLYEETGIAVMESGFLFARWDVSPLGYLATAAHGHLDALHVSLWVRGAALVVDPGTGCYYYDQEVRNWLASRDAHNGPTLPPGVGPTRLGPFLWSGHHPRPVVEAGQDATTATWRLGDVAATRRMKRSGGRHLVVEDAVVQGGVAVPFSVRWQFAPGTTIKLLGPGHYGLRRGETCCEMRVAEGWAEILLVETLQDRARLEPEHPLAGTVSVSFRRTEFAPYLLLRARPGGNEPCLFQVTFLT